MSNSKEKKYKLFKLYSQNLEWVKDNTSISVEPNFSDGYICPLCFEVFFLNDLESNTANPLTLEDIPPASLGGKPLALTCKNCNSTSGHELDNHLLKKLLVNDIQSFLPFSKGKVSLEYNGNRVNGFSEIDKNGKIKFDLQKQHSNPTQADNFYKDMFSNPIIRFENLAGVLNTTPTFHIKFCQIANERRSEIALLRVAYLIAFSTLGNSFLINEGLLKVREQIQFPVKDCFPKIFWINYVFPKEFEGVNIITFPKELQCYLVIFYLKTKSKIRQFAIVLPGPTDKSLNVYNFIKDELCNKVEGQPFLKIKIEHIPNKNYLSSKEYAFLGHLYWQRFTKQNL